MKPSDRTKAFATIRKLPMGHFAPSAPAPFVSADQHQLARRGLWQLLSFLLLSVAAWGACASQPLALLPDALVLWLGAPPPLPLIDLAFGVYLASALILLPGRLTASGGSARGWSQLLYRGTFYLIYLVASALPERFVVVLVAGLVLYGFEQLYFWGMTLWGDGSGRGEAQE